jgi:hypothetical protein
MVLDITDEAAKYLSEGLELWNNNLLLEINLL